ncbi:MAG: hypothetical protein J1E40_05685 [Oscillospiraceae bacterium]|nr:hypothetical protein [Oscillospiraceae bacterium]
MSSLTKKFTEEEMMQMLGELLYAGENITAAVYCIYKGTGFFASSSNIIAGYAAITDRNRLIGYKMGLISDSAVSLDLGHLTKMKISNALLGQKIIYIHVNDGKKSEVKFQAAPKVPGSKFPEQERNLEILLDELKARENLLEQ